MPLLILTFLLQCIDRVMLNSASQFGIIEYLHLYTLKYSTPTSEPTKNLQRFSNATLVFYWGWLAGCMKTTDLLNTKANKTSTPCNMEGPETAYR